MKANSTSTDSEGDLHKETKETKACGELSRAETKMGRYAFFVFFATVPNLFFG